MWLFSMKAYRNIILTLTMIGIPLLLLFYRTCNCESPVNPLPLKRWSDKIVLWSRDITWDNWVENNWWPWERRRRCGSRCSKRHFLNILVIRFLFLHIGQFRESALRTSWSSKVSMGSSRLCLDIWLQTLWLYSSMSLSSFPSFLSTWRGSSWWGRAPCIIFQLCYMWWTGRPKDKLIR